MQSSENDYPSRRIRQRAARTERIFEDDFLEARLEGCVLPRNAPLYVILGGIAGGVLAVLVPVAIALLNAPLFQQGARLGEHMSYGTALAITEWGCVGDFINLVIAFFTGFLVGRYVVLRRLGFYTGALAGGIAVLGGMVANYIPGYPGHISSSGGSIAQGIFGLLIILLLWIIIGGLMSLWGAWFVTRRHPYYEAQTRSE